MTENRLRAKAKLSADNKDLDSHYSISQALATTNYLRHVDEVPAVEKGKR